MASKKELALQIAIAGKVASSYKNAISEATKELSGLKNAVGGIGKGIAVGFGASVAAVAAVSKELVDLGTEFDNAYDQIRIQTGATGEDLAALQENMNNVYSSVPASMEDCAAAISDYNTRLDITGETLETLSTQALQASDMLGEDLGGMVESSSQAFKQWGVSEEDMADKMDYMFKVSQSTGTEMTTLFSEMQTYGAQMQDMGYSFENAAALMGQLDKAGVNTTEVLGAMKKSVGVLAKQGISASDGLEKYCEQIKNAKTDAEAAAIASEVFGSRAGSTMANAIRDGTMSVEDFTKALSENQDTISTAAFDTYDFPEQLEMMKHQSQVALQPIAGQLFSSLTDLMPVLSGALSQVMPIITNTLGRIMPIVQKIFDSIDFDAIVNVFSNIVDAAAPVIETFVGYLPTIMDMVMQIFDIVGPAIAEILPALSPLIDAVMTIAQAVLPQLIPVLEPIMNLIIAIMPLIQAIAGILSGISPIIQAIVGTVTILATDIINAVTPIISWIVNALTTVVDFLTNDFAANWTAGWNAVKDGLVNVWNAIVGAVKGAINGIIRALNWLISKLNAFLGGLNKIKIPDWVPGVGGKGFNIATIPSIPELAQGGIVTDDTIARIGEGNESEAVIPLSKLDTMINGGLGNGEIQITFAPVITVENGDPDAVKGVIDDEFEKFKTYMEVYLRQERRLAF